MEDISWSEIKIKLSMGGVSEQEGYGKKNKGEWTERRSEDAEIRVGVAGIT